ncbi:MAG TPA: non-canonical purine NTP pyrophosphatase [Anaerolineales bacterium]
MASIIRIKSLIYATRNELKFQVATRVLAESGIVLIQNKLDLPEIQSIHVEEIARYAAICASQKLVQPVAVTDAGFYMTALNGFPGPFVRYTNEWFSPQDYLNLMHDKQDRRVVVRECLAFCMPEEEPVTLGATHEGQLTRKAGQKRGTSMDQIFIPAGHSVPVSEISTEEMIANWSNASIWKQLKQ